MRLAPIAAAVLLVALVVVGCGRNSDTPDQPRTTPTTGATGTETTAAQDLGFPTFATKNTTRIGGADAIADAAAAARAVYTGASRITRPQAVVLTDDAAIRALNRDWRRLDKPTNVLSFPSEGSYRGDIAIAYGVTAAEAKAAGKSFADHAIHLVVHGVLHLAGYDHERPKDAKVMEPLEVKILKRLGIADPYTASA